MSNQQSALIVPGKKELRSVRRKKARVDRVGRAGKSYSYFVHGSRNGLLSRFRFTDLKDFGLRLIAIGRPGLGDSDYVPKKSLLSWSKDVQ